MADYTFTITTNAADPNQGDFSPLTIDGAVAGKTVRCNVAVGSEKWTYVHVYVDTNRSSHLHGTNDYFPTGADVTIHNNAKGKSFRLAAATSTVADGVIGPGDGKINVGGGGLGGEGGEGHHHHHHGHHHHE